MPKEEERNTYEIETVESYGHAQIADEVVAVIAGLAAAETEGVDSIAGNLTREVIARIGRKSLGKNVIVEVKNNETVSVKLSLNLKYGYNVPEVCAKVQEKVKQAIENMTGLTVLKVNIMIAGVNFHN